MSNIRIGTYKHYQGQICEVICTAKHKDTHEEMVVYRFSSKNQKTLDNELWVSPVNSFLGRATDTLGRKVPKFEFLG